MLEWYELIFPYMMYALIFAVLIFMFLSVGATKPIFKMRCKQCGRKDRNWDTVAIGHDNFAWQHQCESEDDTAH